MKKCLLSILDGNVGIGSRIMESIKYRKDLLLHNKCLWICLFLIPLLQSIFVLFASKFLDFEFFIENSRLDFTGLIPSHMLLIDCALRWSDYLALWTFIVFLLSWKLQRFRFRLAISWLALCSFFYCVFIIYLLVILKFEVKS